MSTTTTTRTEIEIETDQPDPGYYSPEEIAAILDHRQAAGAAMETRIALRNARNRRRLAARDGAGFGTLAKLQAAAETASAAHAVTAARAKITRRRLGELLGAKRRAEAAARLSPPAA